MTDSGHFYNKQKGSLLGYTALFSVLMGLAWVMSF